MDELIVLQIDRHVTGLSQYNKKKMRPQNISCVAMSSVRGCLSMKDLSMASYKFPAITNG